MQSNVTRQHSVLGRALLGMESTIMESATLAHLLCNLLDPQSQLDRETHVDAIVEALPDLADKHILVLDQDDADAIFLVLDHLSSRVRGLREAYQSACADAAANAGLRTRATS